MGGRHTQQSRAGPKALRGKLQEQVEAQTSSMIAISAWSPRRGTVRMMRV
jgi:hypothetical protein